MKKILITGGSGFIGTNLINKLLLLEYEVLNYDCNKPVNEDHESLWENADIISAGSLEQVFKNFSPDFVIHLCANMPKKMKINFFIVVVLFVF
jgi:nucleoside-diphosphate-sugar epimerase